MTNTHHHRTFSFLSTALVCLSLIVCRLLYSDLTPGNTLKITTWDALGYYMYLPGTFIYGDLKELKWLPGIEAKYAVYGDTLYQARRLPTGDGYYFKCLAGVAILQSPFFFAAHALSEPLGFESDGFSPPYQYALAFGIISYVMLSLFLLRSLLLQYFSDGTVALAIPLLILATNAIQYISVDTGMSHAAIFPLYVVVLYASHRWHRRPTALWACITGFTIGLATISRPTEAIMLFIPLLWHTHSREAARAKWQLVKNNLTHLWLAVLFGFIGILPQLVYWKYATGQWVFDVGSKWSFLSPWFRVLFGWQKGWFIYTPVTVFFIIGLWFVRRHVFARSVIVFTLLNLWIITAWSDWRYGGSYSTRALVQSYPVLAFALAAFIQFVATQKWRWLFYALAVYLTVVNLFQIYQYNRMIIDSYEMNSRYYAAVYLNPHPSPETMSLLDTDEFVEDEGRYTHHLLARMGTSFLLHPQPSQPVVLYEGMTVGGADTWLKTEADIRGNRMLWSAYLVAEILQGDSMKLSSVRLQNGISSEGALNRYAFYTRLPSGNVSYRILLKSDHGFEGELVQLKVVQLSR